MFVSVVAPCGGGEGEKNNAQNVGLRTCKSNVLFRRRIYQPTSLCTPFCFAPKQAVRKRAKFSMRELRRQQAQASSEARSIERSWMAALARWVAQLGKARSAAVDGEVGELRILQREDAEVGHRLGVFFSALCSPLVIVSFPSHVLLSLPLSFFFTPPSTLPCVICKYAVSGCGRTREA